MLGRTGLRDGVLQNLDAQEEVLQLVVQVHDRLQRAVAVAATTMAGEAAWLGRMRCNRARCVRCRTRR